MPNQAKVSPVNYTPEQVEAIKSASPMDMHEAKALGESFDPPKSMRSIIAKIKTLELDYICKPAPTKRPVSITKAQLVELIAVQVGGDLGGLEKATMSALVALRDSVTATIALAGE